MILAIGGVGAYFLLRPQPEFRVEDLSLSSDKIGEGDTVTAQVEITNVGDAKGTHTVELEVEGETLIKEVSLDAGESKTASFEIEKQAKGSYNLNIGHLSETFEVVEPAEFEVSNLNLSKEEVEIDETVTVTVDVSNTGEVSGSRNVELLLDEELLDSQEVKVEGGNTKTVTFKVSRKEAGTYNISISNLTKSFEVLKPAEFKVSDLIVNPSEVEPNEDVEISADVKNIGEVEGTETLELNIEGSLERTKDVTLEGGESTTVTFSITKETPESYSVVIEDLSGSFKVLEPAEFEVSNLQVSPSEVETGEEVEISVDVKNVGEIEGDKTLELTVDGESKTKNVTLKPGESKSVTFTIARESEGTYEVNLGELSSSFEVVTPFIKPEESTVSGNISEDTILTASLSPYTVEETLQVLEDVTLKIEPGTVIKFKEGTGLKIGGELIAEGTEERNITFTSNKGNPSPGDWKGIGFLDGSEDAKFDSDGNYVSGSIISFSTLEYGGESPDIEFIYGGVVYCKQANPFITNTIITRNYSGIFLRDSKGGGGWGGSRMKITNNLIKNNREDGVGMIYSHVEIKNNKIKNNGSGLNVRSSKGIIRGNEIGSNEIGINYTSSYSDDRKVRVNRNNLKINEDYAVHAPEDSVEIDATKNYWGTTNKSEIEDKIYDYYDDISFGEVIFEPIATDPF